MGKRYTTDSINIGDHSLDATMMASLNTVVANPSNYLTTLPLTGGTLSGNLDVNADIQGNTFTQAASGIPRSNLGAPTVSEMALFDNEFTPKTTLANSYDDLTDLTFWVQTTSGSAWTEVTTYSDDQKRKFLRTNNSTVIIPNGAYKFRVEFVGRSYTFANAMYAYWSSNSHNTQVHIWKYNVANSAWTQHTSSSATVSSWPGHLYLPFSTIPWHESNTTSTGQYKSIRVEFTPNWSTGTYSDRNISLSGMQLWGGYPSGRRTVHSYDQNGKLNLYDDLNVPGDITVAGKAGIGTTSPGTKLHVSGDGALNATSTQSLLRLERPYNGGVSYAQGADIAIGRGNTYPSTQMRFILDNGRNNDTNPQATIMALDSSGNVGIGTTSPSQKLEVVGNIQATGTRSISSLFDANHYMRIESNSSGGILKGADGGVITTLVRTYGDSYFNGGNVGIGATSPLEPLSINSGTNESVYDALGVYNSVTGTSALGKGTAIRIGSGSDGNYSTKIATIYEGNNPSYLQPALAFFTMNNTYLKGSETEKMRISANGNVGIGTTSPQDKLEVNGAISTTSSNFVSASTGSILTLQTASAPYSYSYINAAAAGGSMISAALALQTDAGNVGIGTTSPSAKLDVFRNAASYAVNLGDADARASLKLKSSSAGDGQLTVSQGGSSSQIIQGSNAAGTSAVNININPFGGNVGIGTTSPLATLHIDNPQTTNGNIGMISDASAGGTGTRNIHVNLPNYGEGIRFLRSGTYSGGAMKFYSNTSNVGSVQINASSTSYNTTSDYRAKENIAPMENSIDRLKELKPCRFNFLVDPENTVDGFIAHETQEVVPEAITGEKDRLDYEGNPEYQGIDQSKLVPLLTAALKEAISKIEQLETRIQTLENN